MILQDKLYSIQSIQFKENELLAEIILNPNDSIFEGHFPNNPITPGVVQLEIVKELLSIHYNKKVYLKSISNCKYLAILNPEKSPNVLIKISINQVDDDIRTTITFTSENTTFTKVNAFYYN